MARDRDNFVDVRARGDKRRRKADDVVGAERTHDQTARKRCLRYPLARLRRGRERAALALAGHQFERGERAPRL